MIRLALAFTLIAGTAHAGGLDAYEPAPDPCPSAALVQGGMSDAMFANWQSIREMTCGPAIVAPRAFFDRATGERLSDAEILRRVFDQSRIQVVPLPAGGWLLFAGIGALAMWGRR